MVQASKSVHRPVRLCVGCRQRGSAVELLRVVAVEAGSGFALVPDPRRRLPGRGAHLHPDPGCLEQGLRRRAFGRALRVVGSIDTGALRDLLSPHRAPEQDEPGST